MQRPLRSDREILDFAAEHSPSKACETAIRTGLTRIEKWGYGWRVHVTSDTGKTWVIAIIPSEVNMVYEVEWL